MKDTPLRRDTFALTGVLMQSLQPSPKYQMLIDRLNCRALDLVEAVVGALGGSGRFDRRDHLVSADLALQSLRSLLRLAAEIDILSDNALIDFLDQADRVGRQIGGWLKTLARPA